MFLAITKEYGYEYAHNLSVWSMPLIYADLVNKNIYKNPEIDKNGNKKPPIYQFLKPSS